MLEYLPEIKKLFTTIVKKTNDLERLNERVDELLCDEIIKDFTVRKYYKEKDKKYFIYELQEEDFKHIVNYIREIQDVLLPHIIIMAQTDDVENFRILFRKG